MTPGGLVVMGASAGGLGALDKIFAALPVLPVPVLCVLHIARGSGHEYIEVLARAGDWAVTVARDNCAPKPGRVYFAPPDFHLYLEPGLTMSLSVDERVKWCRPSIDVLFESAARALGDSVIGVLLTGANDDGAAGCAAVRAAGGITVVEDPATAEVSTMPASAVDLGAATHVLTLDAIPGALTRLVQERFPGAGSR